VLHGGGVGFPGMMHVKADLLDDISDVGSCEREVLEGLSKAPVLSQISNRRLGLDGDLGLCVHEHRNQLGVHHSSTLKDIKSILALSAS
jgi:hypothetical protein